MHGRKEEQWSQLANWKTETDRRLKSMDELGTTRSHYLVDEQEKRISKLESRIETIEKDTSHFDVMEAEHLRLTKDVENLKNGKK